MNWTNIVILWQPHFETLSFRVSCDKQKDREQNYIIVCCSPTYNGVYSWDATKKDDYDIWINKTRPCYCVPIQDCKYLGPLEKIKSQEIRKEVLKAQKKYLKTVKRQKEPDWLLKV